MTEDASPDLTRLPVREIEPDPDQPRKNFDEDAMAALAESIGENGLLQPIAVRAKKTGLNSALAWPALMSPVRT